MPTIDEQQNLYDRIAKLRETVISRLAPELMQNPQLADALVKQIDDMLAGVVDQAVPAGVDAVDESDHHSLDDVPGPARDGEQGHGGQGCRRQEDGKHQGE